MDIKELKAKLNSLQNKNSDNSKGKDKKQNFWKPTVGKQTIRVVPSKFNKNNPFTELWFYYGIKKFGLLSLSKNFNEKDPISEFVKKLREDKDRESWILAKKLDAKIRIFVPVVERGKESEGVKLWQFGKEVYMEFLNLIDNDEVGDFTDVMNGRDIIVNTVGPESTKTNYNKSTIQPKMSTSVLTEDKDLLKELLENQPDPKGIYTKNTYDELKNMLQEYLTPTDETETEEEEEEEVEASNNSKKENKFSGLFKD